MDPVTRFNSTLTAFKLTAGGAASGADTRGFEVRVINESGTTTDDLIRAEGTWAYTAP